MNAETWVKILFTYGPFAILVLLVFVTEAKLRRAVREAAPEQKRTYVAVYVLNWAAVFALVVYSTYAWGRANLRDEQTIRGRVERLTGFETLATSSASLYFRKVHLSDLRTDYEWRLVAPKKLAGQKVNITVDPSTCSGGEGGIIDYDLTIRPNFYDADVRIFYDPEQKKMFVEADGKVEELPRNSAPLAAPAETAESDAPLWSLFETVAHAGGGFDAAAFARALESADPIVRRNARAELAKQGGEAVPWIEQVLADQKASYRLRLGVISALNNMAGLRADALKPATFEAIRRAADDPDEALRNEARGFLGRYKSPQPGARAAAAPVTVYEHHNYGGRSQGFAPGTHLASRRQFGELPNDSASSLRVERGYAARLCDDEGGGGLCKEFGPGEHQLQGGVADRVSFVQVSRRP